MATYIKTMKDINGDTILPKTNIKAIYDDSGNRLDGILNGSQLPSFTPNLSFSDTIPMHQNGSNVKIRLDDFLTQAGAPYGGVTGRGSNSNGTYIQFADGTMISYQKHEVTIAVTNVWGALYTTGQTPMPSFPAKFYDVPTVSVRAETASGTVFTLNNSQTTTTNPGWHEAARGTSLTSVLIRYHIMAIGRWRA